MDQLIEPLISDDMIDEQLAAEDADDSEDPRVVPYAPDPRVLWGAEGARAMMVVMTRRFGSDFAKEVHNEIASRTLAYQAGCPDDRRDGNEMEGLLCDKFWDELFAVEAKGEAGR